MTNPKNTITALLGKLIELEREIEITHMRLRQLNADIGSLMPKGWMPRMDEVTRFVLDLLRESTDDVPTKQIAMAVMADRGIEPTDAHAYNVVKSRVSACLRRQRSRGLVRAKSRPDRTVAWEVVR